MSWRRSLWWRHVELRKIAEFIRAAADGIEKHEHDWGHEHLSHKQPGFKGSPSFVVCNPHHVKDAV